MKDFNNMKYLCLDLDGVCYQNLEDVFGQVSKRMTQYISKKLNLNLKKAKELQTNYFHKYNTSLNGLMIHHKIDPKNFLDYVHDINLDVIKEDLELNNELTKLKAKKFCYTNGSRSHALNVLGRLGIIDKFDGIFDIVDANYVPKPEIEPYKIFIKKFNINPEEAVFVEDIALNLKSPKELGMKTVWLENEEAWGKKHSNKDFIDLKIKKLSSFLKEINILKVV